MLPLKLERMGVIMEPMAGQSMEVEGVLNPAAARGRDGEPYLFPRLGGQGNYSCIVFAGGRVTHAGGPVGCGPLRPAAGENSATWRAKMPAASLLPVRIHPVNRNCPSSTGRCFPAL